MKNYSRFAVPVFILIAAVQIINAQMPDWKYFRDRAGNSYYIDKIGKIYTLDNPSAIIPPVSPESVEFSLNHGRQIIRSYPVEGLRLLKSILILPEKNSIIQKSQAEAASFINMFKKKHGNRYEAWDRDASVLLAAFDGMTHLVDDEMRFSLEIPHEVTVLKNRERENLHYKYSGLSAGINTEKAPGKAPDKFSKYDILLFIDAESFPTALGNMDLLEENWRNNIGPDTFSRLKVADESHKRIYEMTHLDEPQVSGYEAFYINGNIGYMMRIMCEHGFFLGKKENIRKIIDSFNTVRK